MNFAKAEALLNELDFNIPDDQKEKLFKFVALLDKWNKAYNLTSVRDPNEMWIKHILDSLVVSPHLKGSSFIDVGTGPGLPGIPLAIVNPDKEFILLDSLGKRINFIKQVLLQLGIKNVTPIQSRVEEYQVQKGFDGVLSRAFASLSDMVHWCKHLPNDIGYFYALKGIYNQEEVDTISNNFKIEKVISLDVPELIGERHLILIKK